MMITSTCYRWIAYGLSRLVAYTNLLLANVDINSLQHWPAV